MGGGAAPPPRRAGPSGDSPPGDAHFRLTQGPGPAPMDAFAGSAVLDAAAGKGTVWTAAEGFRLPPKALPGGPSGLEGSERDKSTLPPQPTAPSPAGIWKVLEPAL